MVYFTADLHLGHTNIIRYCSRPFKNVDEMNNTIIQNWNSKITDKDTVVVQGDIAFSRECLGRVRELAGKKILIRGNHDKGFSDTKFHDVGFSTIYKKPYFFIRFEDNIPVFVNCCHAPDRSYLRNGMVNLCGHVHEKWKTDAGFVNVGVDQWNFFPVSYRDILDTYKSAYPRRMLKHTINTEFYQLR